MVNSGLRQHVAEHVRLVAAAAVAAVVLASCGGSSVAHGSGQATALAGAVAKNAATTTTVSAATGQTSTATAASVAAARAKHGLTPLPKPARLRPFNASAASGQGVWRRAGRKVGHRWAVYETTMVPPYGSQPAGIAWMDTRLLSARLYSGSESPGGGPYKLTAPIRPKQARSLVAAFNGGFKMDAAEGGYYTQHRAIYPLRKGAASLVIYRGGSANIGVWGRHVKMTRNVVDVRQNLVMLVANGRPTPLAASANWGVWGATCGASSCSAGVPGIELQWRSALGVTANGALVYVQGPALSPLQLADLLARAGAKRGMELDINPYWPIFAVYNPSTPHGLAAAANGHGLLSGTSQTPATFFSSSWARDFITMSARR